MTTTTPKRIFFRSPGYDCHAGACQHETKGDHGIHNEEWNYAVSFGDYALSLTVYSGIYPSTVDTSRWHLDHHRAEWQMPRGSFLGSHAAFFVKGQEDEFRKGEYQQKSCDYVTSAGCNGDGSGLMAKDFYAKHGVSTNANGPEQSDAFWEALEALAVEWAEAARAERLDAVYERCMGCDGRGLVAKKEKG